MPSCLEITPHTSGIVETVTSILAATAVKTDNLIEMKCRQYNQELKQELQLKFKDIDSQFSQIRKELEQMQLQLGSSQVNNKVTEIEKKMVELEGQQKLTYSQAVQQGPARI